MRLARLARCQTHANILWDNSGTHYLLSLHTLLVAAARVILRGQSFKNQSISCFSWDPGWPWKIRSSAWIHFFRELLQSTSPGGVVKSVSEEIEPLSAPRRTCWCDLGLLKCIELTFMEFVFIIFHIAFLKSSLILIESPCSASGSVQDPSEMSGLVDFKRFHVGLLPLML